MLFSGYKGAIQQTERLQFPPSQPGVGPCGIGQSPQGEALIVKVIKQLVHAGLHSRDRQGESLQVEAEYPGHGRPMGTLVISQGTLLVPAQIHQGPITPDSPLVARIQNHVDDALRVLPYQRCARVPIDQHPSYGEQQMTDAFVLFIREKTADSLSLRAHGSYGNQAELQDALSLPAPTWKQPAVYCQGNASEQADHAVKMETRSA